MSNTIAHLAVARKIFLALQDYVQTYDIANNDVTTNVDIKSIIKIVAEYPDAYYLGTVAPDAIGSKPECTREDKRRVHLREDIRDSQWLLDEQMSIFDKRVDEFVKKYINSDHIAETEGDNESSEEKQHEQQQISFNVGYLVHLLTDKWNHKTIRQMLLKAANANGVAESDREFFHMCVNDLEALDYYLLNKYPDVKQLFFDMVDKPANYYLAGYVEKEYIEGSKNWWKNQYFSSIQTRELKYITEADIEHFIEAASHEIIQEVAQYNII